MSSAPFDPANPYQPPQGVEPKPSVAGFDGRVRYMYIYSFVFENPNWMTNILYGFVCAIIPVIGPLLLLGYQFEVTESLHRHPGRIYPDFNFNKFTYYLVRGIWPFLVSLVISIPAIVVIYALIFVGFMLLAVVASAAGRDAGGIIMLLGSLLIFGLEFAAIIFLNLFVQPLLLRAGLSQDFGASFNFGWAFDFLKKNWLEMLLFQLFLMVTAAPLAMLGMLLCIFPLYAVIALLMLAQGNMLYQLYSLHLSRGGEPIPLKDPPPEFAAGT